MMKLKIYAIEKLIKKCREDENYKLVTQPVEIIGYNVGKEKPSFKTIIFPEEENYLKAAMKIPYDELRDLMQDKKMFEQLPRFSLENRYGATSEELMARIESVETLESSAIYRRLMKKMYSKK